MPTVLQLRAWDRHRSYTKDIAVVPFVSYQIATLPAVIAGPAVMGLVPGGLHWLGAFLVLARVVAMTNAWALLVEIVR